MNRIRAVGSSMFMRGNSLRLVNSYALHTKGSPVHVILPMLSSLRKDAKSFRLDSRE